MSEFTPKLVDVEVVRPPPADFPPGDRLITMVKETVIIKERVSLKKNEKKLVRFSHSSDGDENATDCEISGDCVKRANVAVGLRKEVFVRTHTGTQKPTSAQRLIMTTMTHT